MSLPVSPRTRVLTGLWIVAVLLGVSIITWSQWPSIGHYAFLRLEHRFPPWRNNSDQPITGIIVLGGTFSGRRSPGARFDAGVRLAREFPDTKVVFSGRGHYHIGGDPRSVFLADGIAPDRVEVEGRSANTAENAKFSAALLRPKANERWILVTSAYHMPRAMGAFREAGFKVEADPVDDVSGDYRRQTQIAFKEICGLAYYWLTGRSASLYPGP